jgi:cell wall-associated NlpC family hydrolase
MSTTAFAIPQPVQSDALPKEQQNEKFLNEILSKRVKEIENAGYSKISYVFLQPLEYDRPVINIDTHKTLEEKVLDNYIFYAEYIKVEQGDNAYYFKSQQEADNFLTQIKKYDKNNYISNTSRKLIGNETSQEVLNNVITEKKTAYEKAEAERKRKEEAARKAAAAKKAQQEAAKKKAQAQASVSSSYKATNVNGQAVVNYALQFVGNPYVHGGTSLTNGADCSGFTQSVYKHFGINLPRNAVAQASVGKYVSINNIQPGDLVFYSGNGGKSITHVAIYVGNNKIIHARTPAKGIGVTPLTGGMVLMTIRRVL